MSWTVQIDGALQEHR